MALEMVEAIRKAEEDAAQAEKSAAAERERIVGDAKKKGPRFHGVEKGENVKNPISAEPPNFRTALLKDGDKFDIIKITDQQVIAHCFLQ